MAQIDLTPQEKEVILLKAIIDMLNEMVNNSMIELRGDQDQTIVYFECKVSSSSG